MKGGQKRASKEGGGGVSFSVSLKREWGKGGREIMRVREQTLKSQSILTDSYSLCILYVHMCVCVCGRKTENNIIYARVVRGEFPCLSVC